MQQDIKSLLLLLGFFIVAIGVAGVISYSIFGDVSIDDVRAYVAQYGNLSPIAFLVLTIAFVIFPPAPNDLMAIAAGFLFGFWNGLGLTIIAFITGSMIAWTLGRKFGRPVLKKLALKHVNTYTEIFRKHGAFAVLIARMVPVISFDLVSYVAGICKLHPAKFAAATFVGMIPTVIVLVKIGDVLLSGIVPVMVYLGIMAGISISGIFIFRKFRNHTKFQTFFANLYS